MQDRSYCYDLFEKKLHEMISSYLPEKKMKRKKCLWLNRKVMKATKIRNKKWKLYHRTKNNSDFNSYMENPTVAVKALRKARKTLETFGCKC